MKKTKLLNVLIALTLSLIFSVSTTVNATSTWTMKQGVMSTGRMSLATVVANGNIYAIGGDVNGNQENYTIEEYNPTTDTWTVKAVSHLPRIRFGAAVVNNKIYIIGGSHQGVPYQYDDAVEEYDPVTNQITLKASMPTKREFLGVIAVDNKIYAIGGFNGTGVKNLVEVYDPLDTSNGFDANGNPMGKWTTKASMPTPKFYFSIGEANGNIYTIAGNYNNTILKKVEVYNIQNNSWSTNTDLSISWDTSMATSLNGKIYVAGGGINYVYGQSVVKEYDPIMDTWTDMPNMLKLRTNGGLACVDGKIYAIGGDSAPIGQIEMLDIGSSSSSCCASWTLDGNATDSSGNGNNGTPVGNPTTVTGYVNQALSFSGSNYISIPDNDTIDFGTGDFSIAFWVKTTSTKVGNTIIEKRTPNCVGYDVTLYNGRLLLQIGDSSGYTNHLNTSIPQINNGAWHSAVITVDRDSTTGVKFYIDGTFVCDFDATDRQGSLSNNQSLYFGKHMDWSAWNFVGSLDELKMYTRILSPAEIQQQYTP